jgi:1-acyl-sn-glycerol-3-phosphate acyltransferase
VIFFGAWTLFITLTLTAVFSSLALLTLWLPSGPLIYQKLARAWSKSIFRFSGLRIEIEAHPEARSVPQAIFMANHTSAVDIIAIFMAVPQRLCFIAKDILFKVPLLGWSMSLAGFVSVERDNPHSGRHAVGKLEQRLREGWSVSIFPEGTRSRDGSLLPFKKAGFLVGLRTGIPIVPIGISGAREIMGKDGIRVRYGKVTVRVGAPIQTSTINFEDRNLLAEEVRREILRLSGAE